MSDSAWTTVVGVIVLLGIFIGLVGFQNCDAEARCESLRKQGVKVYVSEGLIGKTCEVIQRDVVEGASP